MTTGHHKVREKEVDRQNIKRNWKRSNKVVCQQQSAGIFSAVVESVLSSGKDLVSMTQSRTKDRSQGLNESFNYQTGI